MVGHGLQGAVLLLGGVGVEVAGYFGGHGAKQGFAVGFGESGAGSGFFAVFVFGGAQALLAQGHQGSDEVGQLLAHGLQGGVLGVGGGVEVEGGEGCLGGGEAVVLAGVEHS